MEIVSSKLVAQAADLPPVVLALAAAFGPLLWLLGWRLHRTLVVAGATLAGGVYGLVHGPSLHLYPIVAAALLSLSLGGLALAILRIGVFVVFGAIADLTVGAWLAHRGDDGERVWIHAACLLGGGLASLICYRLLVIVTTSFAGAFIMVLGGLAFASQHGDIDGVAVASDRPTLLTAALITLGVVGMVGQYALERNRKHERLANAREPAADLLRRLLKARPSS